MDYSLPVLETAPIQFTGEGKTHCEWSTETVEELLASEQKWMEAIPFNTMISDHRKFASNLIDSFNSQPKDYKITLARSSADVQNEEKDIAHLLYRSLLPS